MIGGKVLDPSALAAFVQGSIAMQAWLMTAREMGSTLYLPALVFSEVRAVFPDRLELLGAMRRESQNECKGNRKCRCNRSGPFVE